ncbi:MAG: hypothetical protein H6709_16670 [Kofleriaceae bacterium]|nr:hypothetical protein [Myxococcales bacterium]MCB9561735.1 hypothetical protein [Kofleriaceae bacterium]MCB9573716.1 hypothetical protein [Kofleriaceae bacterium]
MGKLAALFAPALMLLAACGDVSTGYLDANQGGRDGGADATVADAAIDATAAECGNGTVEPGEDCDLGAANNGAIGTCCTNLCAFAPVTVECRAAATGCDVAESCTGASAECPADAIAADGFACVDGGGSTCCGGQCSFTATAGTCDACAIAAHGPQRVTIIESQSVNAGHVMDQQWADVANAAGHTATIVPQTTLDDLGNLADTDILVVSSGLAPLPAERVAVIQAFAAAGHGVYLQGEYQTTYETNIGFATIANSEGATFTWTATVTGQQDPTTVNGCLATTPEAAPTLTAYWYACTGTATGDNIEVIHTAPGGEPIGWSLCFPGGGKVIFDTDQDFIRTPAANTPEHMRNILVALADAAACDDAVVLP